MSIPGLQPLCPTSGAVTFTVLAGPSSREHLPKEVGALDAALCARSASGADVDSAEGLLRGRGGAADLHRQTCRGAASHGRALEAE